MFFLYERPTTVLTVVARDLFVVVVVVVVVALGCITERAARHATVQDKGKKC